MRERILAQPAETQIGSLPELAKALGGGTCMIFISGSSGTALLHIALTADVELQVCTILAGPHKTCRAPPILTPDSIDRGPELSFLSARQTFFLFALIGHDAFGAFAQVLSLSCGGACQSVWAVRSGQKLSAPRAHT